MKDPRTLNEWCKILKVGNELQNQHRNLVLEVRFDGEVKRKIEFKTIQKLEREAWKTESKLIRVTLLSLINGKEMEFKEEEKHGIYTTYLYSK